MNEQCACIRVAAEHSKLKRVCDAFTVEKTVKELTCCFEFRTKDWDNLQKTAIFVRNGSNTAVQIILDETNSCQVPAEVIDEDGEFNIGVFGTDSTHRLPTNLLNFVIHKGCYCEGTAPNPPAQSVYEQIITMMNGHINNNTAHISESERTTWNGKANVENIPTKVSQLNNDAGYLTQHQSLEDYATKQYVDTNGGKIDKIKVNGTEQTITNKTVNIAVPSISGLATETYVSTQINTHNSANDAHSDIRTLISNLTTRINSLADSDDTTLDQLSEIVSYIKNNKSLIDGITTNKVNVSDIINDLTTNLTTKPLSAAQGVALKALIDAIEVPTKTSDLTNDSGYLTQHQDISGKQDKLIAGENIVIAADGKTISAPNNAYESIKQVADYLFEVQYTHENIDYDLGNQYFKSVNNVPAGGCSAVRKGNKVLRHLDWYYDDGAEFVIRTVANPEHGLKASIGMCSGITGLTRSVVESGEYNAKFKIAPLVMTDGINESGVYIQSNVVPNTGFTYNLNPSSDEECCITMLTRYILDHCSTMQEVEEAFDTLHIYSTNAISYGYHFFVSKGNDWIIVELTADSAVITRPSDVAFPIMTNFRVTDLTFTDNELDWDSVEQYGIGLERYDLAAQDLAANKSLEDIREDLMYSKTYTNTENKWLTEFAGYENPMEPGSYLTVLEAKSNPSAYDMIITAESVKNTDKTRDNGLGIWHTTHSAIYDLTNYSFNLVIQERLDTQYNFVLNTADYLTQQSLAGLATETYVDTKISGIPTPDVSGQINTHNSSSSAHESLFAEKANVEDIPTKTSDLINDSGYLTTHQSIKTINNQTIVGTGNITIEADGADEVYIGDTEPTGDQEVWIDTSDEEVDELSSVALTGSYNELIDKPFIPTKTSDLTNDSGFLTSHQSLSSYATKTWVETKNYLTEHQDISGKVNSDDLGETAFSNSYNDLDDLPDIPTVPTKLSDFTDDLGSAPTHTHNQYLTEHQDLEEYAKIDDIPTVPTKVSAFTNDAGYLTEHQSLTGYATKTWVENKGFLTSHQDISGKADKSNVDTLSDIVSTHDNDIYQYGIDISDLTLDKYDKTGGNISGGVDIDGILELNIADEDYDVGVKQIARLDTNRGTILKLQGHADDTTYKVAIENVGTPVNNNDAATKKYVDDMCSITWITGFYSDGTLTVASSAYNDCYNGVIGNHTVYLKVSEAGQVSVMRLQSWINYNSHNTHEDSFQFVGLVDNDTTKEVFISYNSAVMTTKDLEVVSNKTNDIATNSTNTTLYPSAKGAYDNDRLTLQEMKTWALDQFAGHTVWEVQNASDGITYTSGKARDVSGSGWKITGLDLSPYKYILCYVQGSKGSVADQEGASFTVRVDLDPRMIPPRTTDRYISGALQYAPMDNGVKQGCDIVVSSNLSNCSVAMIYSNFNTTGTTALERDFHMFKIEGYKN